MSASRKFKTKDIVDPGHPLLEANRALIESIQRSTHAYGHTDRHVLDVYHPPTTPSRDTMRKPPILVFFYGGSFVRGARFGTAPPQDLVHANLGAFFASRGILAVVADYRLMPGITFPQGSEDVRDALLWVVQNLPGEGDPQNIFVLAHSAGGVHVASLLLSPTLFVSPLAAALKGVTLLGVPFDIGNGKQGEMWEAAVKYYGSAQKIRDKQPIGILGRSDTRFISQLPPVCLAVAGSEPRRIVRASGSFASILRKKGGCVDEVVLDGHDHMSPIVALSSGYGEEWGEEMVEWIRGRCVYGPESACVASGQGREQTIGEDGK